MTNRNEQKFYSALKDVFVGEKVEGESGYVNLMKIKNQYFEKIKPFIENEINETISDDSAREELFEKLYTFFESYFSDTGTPFFDKTQLHKNLYEKVYTERDDVSLFWKTQKLYYVKSEANYTSMDLPDIDGFKFVFDASEIEHQKSNEKKSLEFYLTDAEESKLTFKVRYVDNTKNKWNRLKNYLGQNTPAKVRKHLAENLDDIDHGSINVVSNSLDRTDLRLKFIEDNIIIKNNDDSIQSVDVEFAVSKLKNLETYFAKRNIIVDIDTVKKAFTIYKKQNEVDYFIHKNAEGFLKEQFDIYLYHYLFGEGGLDSDWQQNRINDIQKIKKIAHTVIDYIARFEDELKAIWEKPKFVRNSNYVFTLDRIKDNIELIEKIINHEGFEKQVEEWKELHKQWIDKEGKELKSVWKEFKDASNVTANDIVETLEKNGKVLVVKYAYLPIDTKHFEDIKPEVIDYFDDISISLNGTLIKSENYQVLSTLQKALKNNVGLIYIDPPFNTGDDFLYKDKYQDSTWLTLMHNRVQLSKELLSNDGNFYIHLDENANHLGRVLCDSIFGSGNFNREIIWDIQVLSGFKVKGADQNWVLGHQSILFYSNNPKHYFEKLMQPQSLKYLESFNRSDDNGRLYQVAHGRRIYRDEVEDKGKPFGDVWEDIRDIIDVERPFPDVWNEITSIVNIDQPLKDVWDDIMSFQQQPTSSERVRFDTQKPEALLERIIKSSSDNSKIVLDYFAGSGTTPSVCIKTDRKFIAIEMGDYFETILLPRLKRTVIGQKGTVSDNNNYTGGGFFKYYELEQFEDALRLAKYNPKDDDLANVNFQKDEKLLDAVEIDRENENVRIHFETLYPDVDIAETLSNLLGKKIKKLNNERVIFEDDMEIIFDEMTYEKYPWVKPLIWWKSK